MQRAKRASWRGRGRCRGGAHGTGGGMLRLAKAISPVALNHCEDNMGEGLLQPMHWVVILAIALVVFGPKRLPELGKGLGEAIRGFKASFGENDEPTKPEDGKPHLPS